MMRKYHVRFGGGPGEKAASPTSLAAYPTSAPAFGSGSCLALGFQKNKGDGVPRL